jgi:glucokinase
MIRIDTISGDGMRAINRSAILDFIRRKGPTYRTAIAQELHLGLPTVTRIVDMLIKDGLVILTGKKEFSGGRRRPLLELNAKENVIIGIDLGDANMYGAITDLSGNIFDEKTLENQPTTAEDSYNRLVKLVTVLMKNEKISGRRILGLGVGTQGLTQNLEGIILQDPNQKWENYPLKQKLADDFGLPIVIDNDVNLAALGEHWFGVGQNVSNMVFITVGKGIGAGIILDGVLYRSSNYLSGEIGYFLPGKEYLGKQRGEFGVLESRASLAAIVEKARQSAGEQKIPLTNPVFTPEGVYQAMVEGQKWACDLMDAMIDDLSIAVANVSALLDPDLIVLRSSLNAYTEQLIEPILQRISGLVPRNPKLAASSLGFRATALGAIVEVLYDTHNFYHIRKLG